MAAIGRVGRGKGLPWKGLTPASTYYYIYLLYLIHFGQLIIGHILVIYQSIVISHISVVFHSYIKQHEWMTNVLNALSIKEKIYIYWQNAQAWKSGGSTSNILESPIPLSVRHKNLRPLLSTISYPAAHSALGCTWLQFHCFSDDGLMVIRTIWPQTGCHLRCFRFFCFYILAFFHRFWAKQNLSFKIVIIIICWSSKTKRLFNFIRQLPLSKWATLFPYLVVNFYHRQVIL